MEGFVLTESPVVFYKFGHKYFLRRKQLMGVTTLMAKHELSANYAGVDPAVLDRAADLGSAAHEAIEDYINGLPCIETPLIKSFRGLGLNIARTEYLVSDNRMVASSIDLLAEVEDGVFDIIDMKRTSKVHKESLRWQLGFYKYLFLLQNPKAQVRNCYCLPITKGNKDDILADTCNPLVPIDPASEAEVKAVLDCERNGTLYIPERRNEDVEAELIVQPHDWQVLSENVPKMQLLKAQLKEAEDAIAGIYDAIYRWMLDNDRDTIECEGMEIKLKRPYSRTAFDSARFKKVHPDLFTEFSRTSEVKGNITIKIQDNGLSAE